MKEIKVASILEVYDTVDELPEDVNKLMQMAQEARERAYAPYSSFFVGAALLLENKEIITGSNQENASYPSGLCAERTAIYYAGAKFPKTRILKMAVSAGSKNKVSQKPIPPCGACRQAIAEYEIKQQFPIEIYFMGETGKVAKSASLENLLPFLFDNSV